MPESMLILGVMSGSSLDGLDLAICRFSGMDNNFQWEIQRSSCITYSKQWQNRLKALSRGSAKDLAQADYDFGYFVGQQCKEFLGGQKIDLIASHGHTIFHFPHEKSTCQIGNGAAIATTASCPVICDFRSSDIALGGQGAPIVAGFDQMVFGHIDVMINLGGIVNVTLNNKNNTQAFDIGPGNQLLNYLSGKMGLSYDEGGQNASGGDVLQDLLDELLSIKYFELPVPKSLDNTMVADLFFPILEAYRGSVPDMLRTVIEMIFVSIQKSVYKGSLKSKGSKTTLMLTGGGANNEFLVNRLIQGIPEVEIIVPDEQFINFKEALMMAFLAYLRVNNRSNILASATGALRNTTGGAIYLP